MIHAPLNKLMEKVDSRYTLVSVVAARARELVDHPDRSPDVELKPVTAAVDDLLENRITYERQDDPR